MKPYLLLALVLTLFSACATAKEDAPPKAVSIPSGINHQPWDRLVKKYVNSQGLVAYEKWKANSADLKALNAYLAQYAPKPAKKASGNELAASGINAYNAFAIHWILENYPTDSVMALKDSFKAKRQKIGGEMVSLDQIEHGTMRPALGYRAHAVLVCCARSCPPLQRSAYTSDKVEGQIDTAYHTWLGRSDLNQYHPKENKVEISSIFNWFKADFDKAGGTRKILAQYGPDGMKSFLKGDKYEIEYLPYHWGLNDQSGQGKDYSKAKLIWDKITK